ncbi:hypothetical protein NJLHNGOC_11710 [Novacetimonas cocois]|uniref:Uncharacterized protein n=1 Tax=Novacetimonas cocois TaxID=1747507 RepID=A0A365YUJ0_9PROT|nr:hypothetical protein NJLHNGOC_11710 [Novacetimonas cocois]
MKFISSKPEDIRAFHRFCAALNIRKGNFESAATCLSYVGEDLPRADLHNYASLWDQEWRSVVKHPREQESLDVHHQAQASIR